MYIQPSPPADEAPLSLPKDYGGSVFAPPPTPPSTSPPTEEQAPPPPTAESTQAPPVQNAPPLTQEPPAAAAFAPAKDKRSESSLFARLPFLSSLLPPARSSHGKGGLPEWAVIGLVLLLLFSERENDNDLLPFVLLLLLWD